MIRRTLLVTSLSLLALAPAASAHGPKVIASGLDNPRGIDLAPSGALYVAEAGRGGDGPCIGGGEGGEVCVGSTGAITRVGFGRPHRVVRGLPSIAGEGGAGASGPQDVDVSHFGYGSFVTGLGGTPEDRGRARRGGRRPRPAVRVHPVRARLPPGRPRRLRGHGRPGQGRPGQRGRRLQPDRGPQRPSRLRRGRRRRQRPAAGRLRRQRLDARGLPEPVRRRAAVPRPAAWHQDPEPGRPDGGRQGPRRRLLRLPADRLPVPARQGEHLPRRPWPGPDGLRERV